MTVSNFTHIFNQQQTAKFDKEWLNKDVSDLTFKFQDLVTALQDREIEATVEKVEKLREMVWEKIEDMLVEKGFEIISDGIKKLEGGD